MVDHDRAGRNRLPDPPHPFISGGADLAQMAERFAAPAPGRPLLPPLPITHRRPRVPPAGSPARSEAD